MERWSRSLLLRLRDCVERGAVRPQAWPDTSAAAVRHAVQVPDTRGHAAASGVTPGCSSYGNGAWIPPPQAPSSRLDDVSVTAYDDSVHMSTGEERTGVLILRAWVEDNDEHPLRVRITRTARDRMTEQITTASVTIEGICTVVQNWLEHLVDDRG
jgi:hypothetical protein